MILSTSSGGSQVISISFGETALACRLRGWRGTVKGDQHNINKYHFISRTIHVATVIFSYSFMMRVKINDFELFKTLVLQCNLSQKNLKKILMQMIIIYILFISYENEECKIYILWKV